MRGAVDTTCLAQLRLVGLDVPSGSMVGEALAACAAHHECPSSPDARKPGRKPVPARAALVDCWGAGCDVPQTKTPQVLDPGC